MGVTAKRRSTLALVHAVWGGVSMEWKGNHDVHYGNQPMVGVSETRQWMTSDTHIVSQPIQWAIITIRLL